MSDEISVQPNPIDLLAPKERSAYEAFRRLDDPSLSSTLQAELFELYLLGKSCEYIASQNPGITLGQVIDARLLYGWDEKRAEYSEALMRGVRQRVQETQLRLIHAVSDSVDAWSKNAAEASQRYIQSGKSNPAELFKKMNVKVGKELSEMLLKLTGQDVKKVTGEVQHKHTVSEDEKPKAELPSSASDILRLLDTGKK